MKPGLLALFIGLTGMAGTEVFAAEAKTLKFELSFPAERGADPQDGRMLLLLSTDPADEPRNQISLQPSSQIVFGVTVDHLAPGQAAVVDAKAIGWPVENLSKLPAGDYYVQGL